jgi:hypothetical protein
MQQGHVATLCVYPIKSTAAIRLPKLTIDATGVAYDRCFLVCDHNGKMITGRTAPKLALVQSQLTHSGLQLSAPKMPLLAIDINQLSTKTFTVTVWKDTINAQHCGEQYDHWFRQYLERPCRLVYFGDTSTRWVKEHPQQFAFADGYPLLLTTTASLNILNQRCSSYVSMAQFRPNIVVDACQPFAEDSWLRVRIGEVECLVSKPCSRCIFTTVNPQTAELHPAQEPLTTLKKFRRANSGEIMFGQNLIPLNAGIIRLNDPIEVLETKTPDVYQETGVASDT